MQASAPLKIRRYDLNFVPYHLALRALAAEPATPTTERSALMGERDVDLASFPGAGNILLSVDGNREHAETIFAGLTDLLLGRPEPVTGRR